MLGFFLSLPLSVSAEHFLWCLCVLVCVCVLPTSLLPVSSPECSFSEHLCFSWFFCPSEGDDLRPADIPKPSLPSVLPKKPPPSKTSSSPFSLPPRRPDRPPSLASVHPHQHKLLSCFLRRKLLCFCWGLRLDNVVWFTCPGVTALSLRLVPSHQILPLTGHMTAVSFSCGEMKTCGFIGWRRAHFTPLCLCRVKRCPPKF